MHLIKFVICAVVIIVLDVNSVLASSRTFTATVIARAEPSIQEAESLVFGNVSSFIGAACSIDENANLSGNCDNDNNVASPALIQISGIDENTALSITLSGSSSSFLTVTPAASTNINGQKTQFVAGTPVDIVADSERIDLKVFGNVEVINTMTPGENYQVDYTVEVNFQ